MMPLVRFSDQILSGFSSIGIGFLTSLILPFASGPGNYSVETKPTKPPMSTAFTSKVIFGVIDAVMQLQV